MKRLKLNNIEIGRVVEYDGPFMSIYDFFPDATEELLAAHRNWLEPNALQVGTDMMLMPIQSYIVHTPTAKILVDSCVGNHKSVKWFPPWDQKEDSNFLTGLTKEGTHPDEIDYVFCTHLHVDHSGWNTQLSNGRWVPTFKNAKYIFSKTECDHAEKLYNKYGDPTFVENVLPIIEAGQALLVKDDFELDKFVRLEPTPGHTPGHCAVRLFDGNKSGVISGDLIHSPVQCQFPHWNFKFDFDKKLAAETRLNFLQQHYESGTRILTAHFPLPSTGILKAKGDAFRFIYDKE